MSVSITLDPASTAHLNRQLDLLRLQGPRTVYSSLVKVAYKITGEAKLRLRGRGHVVTARLMNSIFTKTKNAPTKSYTDNLGATFTAELPSVGVGTLEVAIGTNVEYAGKIENMDSFLNWAVNNVDIEKTMREDLRSVSLTGNRFSV